MEWISDFIEEKGRKIHYYSAKSDKPPIVFLHGAMDNGLCWINIAGKLREKYSVIMPDARFHGQTEVLEKKFSYDSMAEDVSILIKNLNLKGVQLIGHSMGGSIAALVAAKYPELVSRVILEDPGFRIGDFSSILKTFLKFLLILLSPIMLRGSYEKLLKKGKKQNPTWPDEVFPSWAESKIQYKKKNPKSLLGFISNTYEWRDIVKNIECPLLLITPSKGITTDKMARDVMELSKEGKWVKIEDSGHNIRREQPEKYIEALINFLD